MVDIIKINTHGHSQKMIEYWRETWHQRTNGNTNLQFPFGFVQVSLLD